MHLLVARRLVIITVVGILLLSVLFAFLQAR